MAIIMAGGEGKRLWPFSTSESPKQLNTTFSKKTMLTETYERACELFEAERVIIVATQELREKITQHTHISSENLVLQPKNMDTAVAFCLAAMHVQTLFPDSVAVFLQSDQKILEPKRFRREVRIASKLANDHDQPILIGTSPLYANTQFGYIKIGEAADPEEDNLFHVSSFHEKPDVAVAERFLASGEYVWNTGIKVWKVSHLLSTIKSLLPEAYESLLKLRAELGTSSYDHLLAKWYTTIAPASFEEAVSERLKNQLVYVADYRWEDMGNWDIFYKLAVKDVNGNAVVNRLASQKVELVDTKNSLIMPRQQRVAVIGLEDVIVVQSDKELLICRRDLSGEVKKLSHD